MRLLLCLLASLALARPGRAQDADSLRIDRERFKDTSLQITEVVPNLDAQDVWQTGPFCGANCLFVLLNLKDIKTSHAQVKGVVTTTNDGANLLEMKNAAKTLGLDCRVVEATPESLERIPLPFIALLGVKKDQRVRGHYVVVYDIADDQVFVVDGTTGNKDQYNKGFFNKSYSGYLLHPATGKILNSSGQVGSVDGSFAVPMLWLNGVLLAYQVVALARGGRP